MGPRRFLALALLTAVAAAAAWYVSVVTAPQTEVELPPLYPGLLERANDIAAIRLRSARHETQLERRDSGWAVANRGGYPALTENVRRLVVNVAELRVIEAKTRRPELYYRLHVQDVGAEDARSVELTMADETGERLVGLLLGKERSGSIPREREALYVRKLGAEQSLLVAGSLAATARAADWMETTVADIDSDRIQAITIRHAGGGRLRIERRGDAGRQFEIKDLPQGREPKSTALLVSLASAMNGLRFDDVAAVRDLELPAAPDVTAVYETGDGLRARVALHRLDERTWARLGFELAPSLRQDEDTAAGKAEGAAAVREEARRLNAQSAGWAYVLPQFKLNLMTKRPADLLAPAESAPAQPEPEPEPAPAR